MFWLILGAWFFEQNGLLAVVLLKLNNFFQRGLSGGCIGDSIVQFQKDTDASCDVTVTSALCSAGSKLDVNSYLLSTTNIVGGGGTSVPATVRSRFTFK